MVTLSASVTGGTPPYSYTWVAPASATVSGPANRPSISATVTRSSYFTVTVTDAGGRTNTATRFVNVTPSRPAPSLFVFLALVECPETLTIVAGGGDRESVYLFTGPGIVSQNSNRIVVNAPGTYTVTFNADLYCPSDAPHTAEITITADQLNIASLVNNGPVSCANSTVTLTASPAGQGSYVFSAGAVQIGGSSGNTATVSAGGTYSVIVTNAYGCEASAQTTVTGNNDSPLVITSQPASASTVEVGATATASVTVSGTGPISYQWFRNNTNSPVANQTSATLSLTNVQLSDAGRYRVVLTSPCNSVTSSEFNLTVNAPNTAPVVTTNANQTATVGVRFFYTVSTFTDPEGQPLTYAASILPDNGLGFNPATRMITGTPRSVGVSTVTVTATDPGSLSASTQFTITVSPAPVVVVPPALSLSFAASPGTLLTTASTTLSANVSGGTTPYSYVFSGPGAIVPSGSSARVSGLSAGVQTFTVTVTDATSPTNQTSTGTVSVTVNAANMAPVATPNANQTATVGTAFTYTVNAFTDPEGQPLTYSASISPANGFSFNAATRVISGTPTSAGVSSVSVTATDPGSLSARTTFTITVNPAPVVVTPLSLNFTASPITLLTSGTTTLSATLSGGSAPYSYTFSGPGTITPSGNTASVSGLSAGVQTFTVVVRDATMPASQTITGTVNVTVTQTNTAPVATANDNQTATVGTAFTYTVNAFTDETLASLTYTASISLANGFSFDPATRIISGTPSLSGVSTVSVTATDPGSLTASTTFTITVNPASVVVSGPFAITGVTTVNCLTLSVGQRQLSFTPRYAGLTGQPISFSVVNEMLPTTNPGPYTLTPYTDNPTIRLRATQRGAAGEVSFSYNWLAACNGVTPPPPPTNQGPTTTGIANQSGTVGQGFSLNVISSFSDPNGDALSYIASGLPAGLSLSGSTISGTPSVSGVSTVSVTATDPGSLSVSTSFTLTVNPATVVVPPTSPFSITGVTTVSCTTISAGQRQIKFTPRYAGLTGQPISFSIVNEMLPTTNPGPYILTPYTDNPTIRLRANQSGTATEASFTYNWLAACTGGARLGAEPVAALEVRVLGNPVVGSQVSVEVRGAIGQPLRLQVSEVTGRLVSERVVERAAVVERQVLSLGNSAAGLFLLRVSTPTQTKTIRVLKTE